ncbi:hypothetical protein, partial [Pseudopedobacter sp.]|uniref:hypothetical protein n=1 Tax=Pseudopedobacter sp. TaxID=1936787 RepID=UPI00333ED51A
VYTNSTGKSFNPISDIDNPNGNYTIEFKAKITNNSGRGIDVVIRDAVSQSPTFNFGSANILVRYSSSNIVTITDNNYTGAIERAYTIAVERGVYNNSDQRNKYHIYADGNYLGTAEGSGNNANYYLQIGHANGAQTIDANIYYVAVDYAGAYKPETVKPLPVSLVDYSVKKNLNTAQLDWETATELNNR